MKYSLILATRVVAVIALTISSIFSLQADDFDMDAFLADPPWCDYECNAKFLGCFLKCSIRYDRSTRESDREQDPCYSHCYFAKSHCERAVRQCKSNPFDYLPRISVQEEPRKRMEKQLEGCFSFANY